MSWKIFLLLTALLAGALASDVAAGPVPATAQTGPPEWQAARNRLLEAAGGRGRVAEHPATGRVRFFGTEQDRPVARAGTVGPAASPEAAARGFLDTYGPLFGADDARRQLGLQRTVDADRGRSSVRFQQLHRDVPVVGGELVVNLDESRRVLSASGELSPQPSVDVAPAIPAADATAQAIAAMAKQHEVGPGSSMPRRRRCGCTTPSCWAREVGLGRVWSGVRKSPRTATR